MKRPIKTTTITSITTTILCLGMIFTNGILANDTVEEKPTDLSIQKEQIEKLINDRTSVMISDNNLTLKQNNISDKLYETENQTRALITEHREKLKKMNETYKDTRTQIDILESKLLEDKKLSIKINETTYLTIAQNEIETGYTAEHEFIFNKNENDVWILLEDRQLEPTGILPLQQAEQLVYNYESTNNIELDSKLQLNESFIPSSNIVDKNYSNSSGYNYTAMATYLERYWSSYNPAYRNFTNQGGDCTNFVSQALKAGGWSYKPGWYQNANYWWYNSTNQTYSWTSVNHWATFAKNSGRTSMLASVWSCRKGDVVQVKPYGSSSKVHTMMVSYYSNGIPYFTYHTSNRYRRSLNQVLLDWPIATFYAYRT